MHRDNAPHTRRSFEDRFGRTVYYRGTFRTEGDTVIHDVLFASIPHWIGNPLVRTIVPKDGDVLLNTAPEFSKSGAEYVHQLLWRRVDG